ncbi:zinc-binding domain-containing protein [Hirsutella rhossiliensis]|uniref:Zinc-binding domain-containing protein n=1 Tax=Hirsutella rhossiliensis TaxID=111463 RepID=A0A9P8SQ11_9HYPO|nr:zinc-binding domain-containing protein [Hirsutella rhossiliensis]KAH0968751.1 zinc-binding domain-containing protein [Hirsutella rhossiliensis]
MPNRRNPPKRWSMYPKLHDDVSGLLEEEDLFFDFHTTDDGQNCDKQWDTNVMGRFVCPNRTCDSHGWSSKKIAVTIRMYSGAQYNVRVYHQRCKSCSSLSRPILDSSYAERTAYRLKKWCGIQMETPPHGERRGPPHNRDLCEGCKDGHCSEFKEY